MSGNGGQRDFKRFGWQGIRLTVPSNWEMVSTRGDCDSGFVSLADNSEVRLQVKWDRGGAKTDPSDSAARYIRGLRKQAKKDDQEITVNRHLSLASLRGKKTECYEWITDNRGTGLVSVCEECKRIVHLIILGRPDESLRNLSRTLFASLQDHPEDDELLWRFFDLEFRSPENLPLKQSELKTGCIRMQFQDRSEQLEVVRSSLARMLLKDTSLKEWFEDFYSSGLKRTSYEVAEHRYKGHEGLKMDGRPWLVFDLLRPFGRGKKLRAACWHCEESNRIFIVSHLSKQGPEVFERVVETTVCCE